MSGGWDGWGSVRTQAMWGRGLPRGSSVLCWHSSPGHPQPWPQGTALHRPGVLQSPAQPMLPSSGHGCELGPAVRGTNTRPAWDLPAGSPRHSTPPPCAVTCGGDPKEQTQVSTWAPFRDSQRQDIMDWGSPMTTRRCLGLRDLAAQTPEQLSSAQNPAPAPGRG